MTIKEKKALLYVVEHIEANLKVNQDRLPSYLSNVKDPDFPFLSDFSVDQVESFHAGVFIGLSYADELIKTYFF